MKKVFFVITKSNWGGAQRYVYDLATSVPREEFDVSVAFGARGRLADMLEKAGIETLDISSLQRDISFGADFRSFRELVRLFKKLKPDVVHLNSSKVGGLGSLAARVAGVPNIIFTAHGWPFWEKRSGPARAAIWLASWATALLAHHVIVISDYDMRVARKMPFVGHKVTRIYNGIGPMELSSGDKVRAAFPTGVKITGTIGELTKNKNQAALIEQAAKNPEMYVAIVGEGELREELEKKIQDLHLKDRVKLFGFMPASEVLRGFDTFALPSIKEGLPYVLLEAKATALPIVASRVGGIGEILDSKDPNMFSLSQMVEKTVALYRI